MITIEIPTWLAIIILILMVILMLYFIVSDLFTRWLHKHYQLELKEREDKENEKEN